MKIATVIAILGTLLLAGCASSKYVESYTAVSAPAAVTGGDFKPTLHRSLDLQADVADLQAEGYTVLGTADFTGELESDAGIYQQARAVGATLVLKNSTFLNTRSVEKTVYKPNSTTDNTTAVNRGTSAGNKQASRNDPAATPKGSIPHTVQQSIYRQQAVFLVRDH